eukprot:TRINITY_DN749_c0_g2_i1.p1 TRINITY_DN749_c0_g2~~TRINITY_DN749_c0_g2_i1.p1  ORF type:complete len:317 (+),score=86.77 TRINITY_DN749_c0_g2_i1:340-1290(+)
MEEALEVYTECIENQPNSGTSYGFRAYVHNTLGNFNESIKDYDKAIEIKPISYFYTWRGQVKKKIGKLEEANNDFNLAIQHLSNVNELDMDCYDFDDLSKAYFELKNYDRSLECCSRAIELSENSHKTSLSDYKYQKARILIKLGKYDLADECIKSAAKINSSSYYYPFMYSLLYYKKNEYLKAIKFCDKCIEHTDHKKKVYIRRAKCHYALGNIDQALIDLNTYLDHNPLYNKAKELSKIYQGQSGSVYCWLSEINMIKYYDNFISEGFDEIDICKELTDDDIQNELNIDNEEDQQILINAIKSLNINDNDGPSN